MELFFRFAYSWLLYGIIPVIIFAALYRWYWYKPVFFRFSLTDFINEQTGSIKIPLRLIAFLFRLMLLVVLGLLIARPQLIDTKSYYSVEGIDIMLVMDLSGSMQCFDDVHDQRPRIDVAKKEAISFIARREHDPIGLVIFGRNAVSRCPLTLDKKMLTDIINDLRIGVINQDGTVLSVGIAMGANRLKHSQAASKVMIVLTDGVPTQEDIDPQQAIDVAKKLGIKIYTIGIGDDQKGGLINHPHYGLQRMPFSLDKKLLAEIAAQTGGRFFEAKKPQELQKIYAVIDALEKTEHEAPVFTRYFEFYAPFMYGALILVFLELLFGLLMWFGV